MISCHICENKILEDVTTDLRFVASDVSTVVGSARFSVCGRCTNIQKILDNQWNLVIEQIYKNYSVFTSTPEHEHVIFNESSHLPRSRQLLSLMREKINMKENASLLDFGCANGLLLQTFRKEYPSWHLSGLEINDRYRNAVLGIGGNLTFYGDGQIPANQVFDIITLSHVLEHIQKPVETLKRVRAHLKPEGRLVLSVPNIEKNPFDLLVADHCTHFQMGSLRRVLEIAGFSVEIETESWIPKELTVIASVRQGDTNEPGEWPDSPKELTQSKALLRINLRWLDDQKAQLGRIKGNFAVFGSSIAACWCASEFEDKVSFFVDENSARHNKIFMGKKIYSPQNAPKNIPVFIALPPPNAHNVRDRLEGIFSNMILPTEL